MEQVTKGYWQHLATSDHSTFDAAVTRFMDFFCEQLDVEKILSERKEEIFVYYLDMSSIQMKVSEITPFYITKIKSTDQLKINHVFLKIKNKIYENQFHDQVSFVVVIGQTGYFKTLCKDSLLDIVVLDQSSINQIIGAEKPRSALIKISRSQINVQRLSPYETIDPVVGRMFYGRKLEMQQLINSVDKNFVITGCRKIGKSSLILNAFQRMREEQNTFPVFLDCYPYKSIGEFVKQVVTRLEIRELRRMRVDKFHDFLRRMKKKYKKGITFILDEADRLLEIDKNYGWELFHILSSAHTEGYCRFIITGYRTVFEQSLNLDSPIYKFMEPIRIHDLDYDSARALITQPIGDMGIVLVERGKIIEEILKQTSRQPNMIQFICKKLIEIEGERNSNEITLEDVLAVEKSSEYRHYISDTFIVNANPIEQLIAFCMLDDNEFTLQEIDTELERKGISLESSELERICIILEMANVFHKEGKNYRFAHSVLSRILKEDYDRDYKTKKLLGEVKKNERK
jgi:hypothetical protein